MIEHKLYFSTRMWPNFHTFALLNIAISTHFALAVKKRNWILLILEHQGGQCSLITLSEYQGRALPPSETSTYYILCWFLVNNIYQYLCFSREVNFIYRHASEERTAFTTLFLLVCLLAEKCICFNYSNICISKLHWNDNFFVILTAVISTLHTAVLCRVPDAGNSTQG